MKSAAAALVSGLIAFFLFFVLVFTPTAGQAEGEPVVASCSIVQISGPVAQIQCVDPLGNIIPAGQVNLPSIIEEVEVLLPGETVTDIIKIPGPTKTKTVEVPGPTKTETVPGPTVTETETVEVPGPTRTERVEVPGPVRTETVKPEPQPTVTETTTETVTVTKEVEVDKPEEDGVLFDPPPVSPVEAVGYSSLALIVLCGLIILGLWLGYLLGYKDKERNETRFLSALRDQFYYKGNHS